MSTVVTHAPGDVMVRRNAEVGLALAVVFIIALLVVPLPAILLDLLLALSIALSVVILLVALSTVDPLDFSSFPALLLLLTLFRLALNVASTRLILGEGDAGSVIQAFGEFVIGGNYAVGVILFLILVGINFIVITKGAGRVAEVAARFTLDAMPGKQMSIDADVNAGILDEAQARRRREEISRQADFYGAMDGASKFVKGDAIAGLLITGVNILGGIFIGVVQRGMPVGRSVSTYMILTVGDGLVSQIPALVVSTAAGIMVTHASGGSRMGAALANQLGSQPRAMWIAAGVMTTFGLIPGLPAIPFLALGGGIMLLARGAGRSEKRRLDSALAAEADARTLEPDSPLRDLLQIDPIELEVGYALITLVDESEGGDLLQRISLLRKQAALELGILIPPVRLRDDIRLPANEYVIKLRGAEIARAEVMPRFVLALDTGGVVHEVDGIETLDPSFGTPARWVSPTRRMDAESFGYVVVEPATVVATHLMETLKSHAGELLGRQDVQEMTEALRKSHPALVDDVVPGKISLGVLHRVLQRLLKERLPIRDLVTILEALGDAAEQTKDPEALTEYVRRALGHVIARLHMDPGGVIQGVMVGPRLEVALMGLFSPRAGQNTSGLLDPDALASMLRDLGRLATGNASDGRPAPLIAPPALRAGIRRLIEPVLPAVPVLSLAELPPQINIETIATWELTHG
jgi:flagellar biosynthesis protein FlhA